ncbi:MAG: helix-turn-helix domain-containing protein [Candidatus Omnitrophica bacterium]|nr:helix-turn-helix domain-containing protein [Candidatus Omnitrophota bacterium]
MQEKLLSLKAAADYLGISEKKLKELSDYGVIPAYRIAGIYLRFRRSQLLNLKDKISGIQAQYAKYQQARVAYEEKTPYGLGDRLKDFWHFYDFYIISLLLIVIILAIIFRYNL